MNRTTEIIQQTCDTINFSSKESLIFGFILGIVFTIVSWLLFNVVRGRWRHDP